MPQVNLLPEELRPKPLLSNAKVLTALGAGLVMVLLLSAAGGWFWYLNNLESKLADIAQQRQQLKQQLAEVDQLEQRISDKQAQLKELQAVVNNRLRWAKVFDDVGQNFPKELWLESLATQGENLLVIKGRGDSLADVGVLVHQLDGLPYFDAVVLNQMQESDQYPESVDFQVTARLAK